MAETYDGSIYTTDVNDIPPTDSALATSVAYFQAKQIFANDISYGMSVPRLWKTQQDLILAICWKFKNVIVWSEYCESKIDSACNYVSLTRNSYDFFFNMVLSKKGDLTGNLTILFHNINKAYPHVQLTILCLLMYSNFG